MHLLKSTVRLLCTVAMTAMSMPASARQAPSTDTVQSADWRETYAYNVGMQAVIYGYPIVKNTTVRYHMVEKPNGQVDVPLNTWFHSRRAQDHRDKLHSSVTADLLYSAAWFDVSKEPLVLTVPDSPKLYYSIQMMEMFSDIFAYVGTRATGGKAGKHLLVGPQWAGETPVGVDTIIRAPQDRGMLILRAGFADRTALQATHNLQDQVDIAPLSKWQSGDASLETARDVVDPATPPSALPFFATMNRAMSETPPPAKDAAFVSMMKSVGLGPGQPSDFSGMDAATQKGLQRAMIDGLAFLKQVSIAGGNSKTANHWVYGQKNWGRTALDNDVLTRSANQSYSGMQEHWVEEVTKLRAHHDGDGDLLDGTHARYTLRFASDQLPKAKSFWSVTVYDEQYDLVENPIARFSLGSVDKAMRFGKDGSLTLYLQTEPPAKRDTANWLPIPKGKFNLFLRAYLPAQDLIDQNYVPPPVVKAP